MKQKYKISSIAFIIIILVVTIIITFLYSGLRRRYIQNFKKMESYRTNLLYQQPFFLYFYSNFEPPKNINELIFLDTNNNPDFANYINSHFRDFLSRGEDSLIRYYPIYNSMNLKREGYVLLSAGIDGEINNVINNDSLFESSFIRNLKLYNPSNYYQVGDTIEPESKIKFNLFNYFFGKKDYLIEYIDQIELYKQQAIEVSINELVGMMRDKPNIRNRTVKIKGQYVADTTIDNNLLIILGNGKYNIRCFIYDEYYDKDTFCEGDILSLIGIMKSFKYENNFSLFNCIQLLNHN